MQVLLWVDIFFGSQIPDSSEAEDWVSRWKNNGPRENGGRGKSAIIRCNVEDGGEVAALQKHISAAATRARA